MDLASTVRDAEDRLFPARSLDPWERALYYHLLRRTHVDGVGSLVVALDPLARAAGMSSSKAREILRALHSKGCVVIDDRSRQGHSVRVLLPSEVLGPPPAGAPDEVDLESLDVFTGRRYIRGILAREGGRCFYCLRVLTEETCTLDHVSPQVKGIDNSFRNVVAACHGCNTTKQSAPADAFLRELYRSGVLARDELAERFEALAKLRAGELRPAIDAPAV